MKLRIVREGNYLLGLYWCGAVNEIALNLAPRFGIRLSFEFSEQEETRFSGVMLDLFAQKARLNALSNEALVAEVLNTETADDLAVMEMVDRLCPDWHTRDEEHQEHRYELELEDDQHPLDTARNEAS